VKMEKPREEKSQKTAATGGTCRTPQTAVERDKPASENPKPAARVKMVSEKVDTVAGKTLLEQAQMKATKEMQAKYDYASLCEQGRELYAEVLQDKTRRLHAKLKHRDKYAKKKRDSQPEI